MLAMRRARLGRDNSVVTAAYAPRLSGSGACRTWHRPSPTSGGQPEGDSGQPSRGASMSARPSGMGEVMSSLPDNCHVAELTLLSVVDAEAATLCCQRER